MIISPSNVSYFFTHVVAPMFYQAYDTAPTFHDKIATTIPSTSEQNGYGWMGMVEKLRMWKGPRTVHSPAPYTYFVTNQPFELTLSIDEFRLEDDTYGIYFPMITNMGKQSKKWPDYQLRDLITAAGDYSAASLQLSLDGVAHWSASHLIDPYKPSSASNTYVNDYGTAGTSSIGSITCGGYLTPTAYSTVWTDMCCRVSENGEALGIVPSHLVVPPQLDMVGKTILHAQFFSPQTSTYAIGSGTNVGAMQNVLVGSSDLIMLPDLAASSATAWYLLDCTKALKPFIWQLRQAPDFVARVTPNDPVVFDSHTYLYGTKARGAPGWGLPFLSSRSGV